MISRKIKMTNKYQFHTVCSKDFQKKIALLRLVWAYFYKVQKCDHAWIYHFAELLSDFMVVTLCKKNWLVKIWYFSILFLPERLLLKRNYVAFLLNSKMHVPTNFLRIKIAFCRRRIIAHVANAKSNLAKFITVQP